MASTAQKSSSTNNPQTSSSAWPGKLNISSTSGTVHDGNVTSALTDRSTTSDNSQGSDPQSPHSAAQRERGMSITAEWKPAVDRRQSWSAQEYKHEQHKHLGDRDHKVRYGGALGGEQGFTERG